MNVINEYTMQGSVGGGSCGIIRLPSPTDSPVPGETAQLWRTKKIATQESLALEIGVLRRKQSLVRQYYTSLAGARKNEPSKHTF